MVAGALLACAASAWSAPPLTPPARDEDLFQRALALEVDAATWRQARQLYVDLEETWPESKRAPGALFRAGVISEKLYDYEAALFYFSQFRIRYVDGPERVTALTVAARVAEGLSRIDASERWLVAASVMPQPQEALNARLQAVRLLQREGQLSQAREVWAACAGVANPSPENRVLLEALGHLLGVSPSAAGR